MRVAVFRCMLPASLDLRSRVTLHPWQAIAGAALLGAWTAAELPRLPHGRIARAALATIGAVTLRVARDLAIRALIDSLAAPPAPEHPVS